MFIFYLWTKRTINWLRLSELTNTSTYRKTTDSQQMFINKYFSKKIDFKKTKNKSQLLLFLLKIN